MNNSINAIRFLGMDAINKANSGHPGIVLGAAPTMYNLYTPSIWVNSKYASKNGSRCDVMSIMYYGTRRRMQFGPPLANEIAPIVLLNLTGSSLIPKLSQTLSICGTPFIPHCTTKPGRTLKNLLEL